MKKFMYDNCKLDIRGFPIPIKMALLREHMGHVPEVTGVLQAATLYRKEGESRWDDSFYRQEYKPLGLANFFEKIEVHTIQIDGKTIELSEQSYQELKKQLVDS